MIFMRIGIFVYKMDPNYYGGVASYVSGLLNGFLQADNREIIFKILCSSQNYNFFEKKFKADNFEIVNVDDKLNLDDGSKIKRKVRFLLEECLLVLPLVNIVFKYSFIFFNKKLFNYLDNSGCDLIYSPHAFPLYLSIPVISSIHDIQHVHYPEFFSWRERIARKIYFRETVNNSQIIQASSEYMAKDFRTYFKLNNNKVEVIKDGVDPVFGRIVSESELQTVKKKFALNLPFVFFPAQHWKHKNHFTLIKAISILEDKYNLKLDAVFTGQLNKKCDHLYKNISESKISERIRLVGNVSLDELICLYKLSRVVAMPSLHESNSLVVLEALSAGTLVVASDIEPNLEINNNAFAIFKQLDADDLAKNIFELINSDRSVILVDNGKALVKSFTWKKTADNYIKLFESLRK